MVPVNLLRNPLGRNRITGGEGFLHALVDKGFLPVLGVAFRAAGVPGSQSSRAVERVGSLSAVMSVILAALG